MLARGHARDDEHLGPAQAPLAQGAVDLAQLEQLRAHADQLGDASSIEAEARLRVVRGAAVAGRLVEAPRVHLDQIEGQHPPGRLFVPGGARKPAADLVAGEPGAHLGGVGRGPVRGPDGRAPVPWGRRRARPRSRGARRRATWRGFQGECSLNVRILHPLTDIVRPPRSPDGTHRRAALLLAALERAERLTEEAFVREKNGAADAIVAGTPVAPRGPEPVTPAEPGSPEAERRSAWAQVLKNVFEVDPLVCPKCGGETTVIAWITDRAVIDRILAHRPTVAEQRRGSRRRSRRGGRRTPGGSGAPPRRAGSSRRLDGAGEGEVRAEKERGRGRWGAAGAGRRRVRRESGGGSLERAVTGGGGKNKRDPCGNVKRDPLLLRDPLARRSEATEGERVPERRLTRRPRPCGGGLGPRRP